MAWGCEAVNMVIIIIIPFTCTTRYQSSDGGGGHSSNEGRSRKTFALTTVDVCVYCFYYVYMHT